MFKCFDRYICRKSNIIEEKPKLIINIPINQENVLPPSPKEEIIKDDSLTPEQLKILQTNLQNLIDFNDTSYMNSNPVIQEVYYMLKSIDNDDPGISIFESLLDSSYELINILPIPGADIISWFIGGILHSYTNNPDTMLNEDFGEISIRYNKTYYQIRNDLTTMYDNINEFLDIVYNIPDSIDSTKKTITLRELLNYNVPDKYSENYTKLLQAHTREFRSSICKREFPNANKLSLLQVEVITNDPISRENVMPADNNPLFALWWDNKASGNGIDSDPFMYACKNKIPNIEIISDTNDHVAYIKTLGDFVTKIGSAFIVDIGSDPKNTEYYYYLVYFLASYYDGDFYWNIADKSLSDWLFKDDGFGNIINPDGCGMRSDIIKNWGVTYGNNIISKDDVTPEMIEQIKIKLMHI
jgi:hypothetical protein